MEDHHRITVSEVRYLAVDPDALMPPTELAKNARSTPASSPPASAETLRRIAWDIAMAGAYGTAGESARRGVSIWQDTGGGWINGRGDDSMIMLKGYEHMVDFFTSFEWWKTGPHGSVRITANPAI